MEFYDYKVGNLGKVSKQCHVFLSLVYCFFASFYHWQQTVLSALTFSKATLQYRKDYFKVVRDLPMHSLLKNLWNFCYQTNWSLVGFVKYRLLFMNWCNVSLFESRSKNPRNDRFILHFKYINCK